MRFFDNVTIDGFWIELSDDHVSKRTMSARNRRWDKVLFDIYVGEDIFEEETSWYKWVIQGRSDIEPFPACIVEKSISHLFSSPRHHETPTSLYRRLNRTKSHRVGILWAHAGFKEGAWVYGENKETVEPVQDWVDRTAGTPAGLRQCDLYGALLVVGCNENRCEITSPLPSVAVYYPMGKLGFLYEFTIACTK